MSRAVKKLITDELTTRFTGVDAGVLIDYRGLTAGNMHELRRTLREKGARLTVVKNSLVMKAMRELGFPEKLDEMVEGSVAVAYGGEEASELAKALSEWKKKSKSKLEIRGGFLESAVLTAEDVEELAKLPSREQMLGIFLGTLNAPVRDFVSVLAATIRGLCNVFNAIGEKKGGEA